MNSITGEKENKAIGITLPKFKRIQNVTYFTKGHRGVLYTGDYKNKKVVIKTGRKESKAVGRIENEADYLKILGKKGIGPKLCFYNRGVGNKGKGGKEGKRGVNNRGSAYLVYEYIEGLFFPVFLEHSAEEDKALIRRLIKDIIKDIFIQCFRMDKLNINKEEMHHPYKHIIIEAKTKRAVLVDFERCHKSKKPKNVTQFCSYILSDYILNLLKEKGIRINKREAIEAAKRYRRKMSRKGVDNIISLIRII